jgi:hypothetical protein
MLHFGVANLQQSKKIQQDANGCLERTRGAAGKMTFAVKAIGLPVEIDGAIELGIKQAFSSSARVQSCWHFVVRLSR